MKPLEEMVMPDRERMLLSQGEPLREGGRIPTANPEWIGATARPPDKGSAGHVLVHLRGNET